MNKVVLFLILSDIVILSSFGLFSPIFAIFIKEGLTEGSIVAAGIATTIFLITKSIVQLPYSRYLDKQKRKIPSLLFGTFLIVLIPFIFAISNSIKYVYFGQVIYGFGAAIAYPAWFSLFTMNLDKKHKGFEYSLWSTGVGLGTALTAYLGARLSVAIGFRNLFFIVGSLSFVGWLILIFLTRKKFSFLVELGDGFEKEIKHLPFSVMKNYHK